MDQAQTRALAAVQPFVHLATTQKNPSARFVCDLINRAISAPGTYLFTELLQTPAVQSLRGSDSQSWLTLLEIFSWGTLEEYKATPGLPKLDDSQILKLRQLTLLTLASPFAPSDETSSPNNLTYDSLLASLSLPDPASLESIVVQSIYSGLLTARLSPTSNPPVVNITSVAPLRDLRPQSLPALLQILQTWESRCTSMVNSLEAQITAIRATANDRSTTARRRQDVVDAAVLSEKPQNENLDAAKAALAGRGLRSALTKLPSKRNLDAEAEGDDDEPSDDEGRMDLDEGVDVGVLAGITGAGGAARGGGSASGSSRGAKRNRGRGK